METSPIALYPKPSAQLRKPTQQAQPKFSGAIDGFSNLVGFIDSNRLAELTISDGVAMVGPRTIMASSRGADDARETFLREFSGLIGNVLITGWFGYGMLKLLGGGVNAYNPHGTLSAHINASNLDAFGKLYHKALSETKDPGKARKQFIEKFMAGLGSNNSQFMAPAQLESIFRMTENRPAMIKELLTRVESAKWAEMEWGKIENKSIPDQRSTLEKLLKDRNGKLSTTSQAKLAEFFQPKSEALKKDLGLDAGTLSLDSEAHAKIQDWIDKGGHSEYSEKLAQNKAFRDKETLKVRMDLFKHSTMATEDFVKRVDQEALNRGVTGNINIMDGENILSAGQSRKNTLRELKYFLEHFVDRATFEAKRQIPDNTGKDQTEAIQKRLQAVEARLFKPANKGFLHQFLPKAEDGLLVAAAKQKKALIWVPITLSVAAAGAFTFYNQYITTKKHGGKMFFPGEGGPETGLAQSNAQSLATQGQVPPLNRNFRPSMGFQQGSYKGGGVLT